MYKIRAFERAYKRIEATYILVRNRSLQVACHLFFDVFAEFAEVRKFPTAQNIYINRRISSINNSNSIPSYAPCNFFLIAENTATTDRSK